MALDSMLPLDKPLGTSSTAATKWPLPSNRALAVITGKPVDIEHGRRGAGHRGPRRCGSARPWPPAAVALDKPPAMHEPLAPVDGSSCTSFPAARKGASPRKPPAAVAPGDVHTFKHVWRRDLSRGNVDTLLPGIPWTLFRALCKAFEVRLGKPPAAVALDIEPPSTSRRCTSNH